MKSGKKKVTELDLIDKYLEKVMAGSLANHNKQASLKELLKKKSL